MTTTDLNAIVAAIRLWQIQRYYDDLVAYYEYGDHSRFTRMVVDGGKSLPSAHPAGWVQHIVNLTPVCIDYHRDLLLPIYAQLRTWGHDVWLEEMTQ